MDPNSEIGNRIKTLRKKQNLTQQEIANALQISSQAVTRWVNGDNLPDIALLCHRQISWVFQPTSSWGAMK
jgi:DNA-binding XRE family transcriptional regulator